MPSETPKRKDDDIREQQGNGGGLNGASTSCGVPGFDLTHVWVDLKHARIAQYFEVFRKLLMNMCSVSSIHHRAVNRRGVAVLLLSQSGSGKTRLVRSDQLRHIWRDAVSIKTRSQAEEMKEGGLEQHDGKCEFDYCILI